MEDRLLKAQQALTKHGIDTRIVATAAEAKQLVLDEIEPGGQKVGVGGSRTVDSLGVVPELEAKGCQIYWHWRAQTPPATAKELRAGPTHSRCFFWPVPTQSPKTVAWSISMVPATGWRLWYMARIK